MNETGGPNGCKRVIWSMCCGREYDEFKDMENYYKNTILVEIIDDEEEEDSVKNWHNLLIFLS